MSKSKVLAIDFDGTCVTHEFPYVGKDIGAVPVLKDLVREGHRLILFTMRSNVKDPKSDNPLIHLESGNYLDGAVHWFKVHEIPLYGINTNPEQSSWTSSPKAYSNLLIDDSALGIPLITNLGLSSRPFVDWVSVRFLLERQGYLSA
jgi:hypothetical protein